MTKAKNAPTPTRTAICAWCGESINLSEQPSKKPVRSVTLSANLMQLFHSFTDQYGCTPACEGHILTGKPIVTLEGAPVHAGKEESNDHA